MTVSGDLIVCRDPKMAQIMRMAESVAHAKATVLISGESGTGKELLARFIHSKSPRSNSPFIAINCAAVPEGLLESELFGFEKGAFTGALQSKPGKFELAQGGTLLLDELGEMPLSLQAKLLRVLQEQEVERLGGRSVIQLNIRVIATTHRSLGDLVREGKFREDLLYRLAVVTLHIPPLRERPLDLDILIDHVLEAACHDNNLPTKTVGVEARQKLLRHPWGGNVRELENVMERAVLLSQGSKLEPSDFSLESTYEPAPSLSPGMTVAEVEKLLIFQTLDYTGNNKTQAARLLGISVRTLRNKLHTYGGSLKAGVAYE